LIWQSLAIALLLLCHTKTLLIPTPITFSNAQQRTAHLPGRGIPGEQRVYGAAVALNELRAAGALSELADTLSQGWQEPEAISDELAKRWFVQPDDRSSEQIARAANVQFLIGERGAGKTHLGRCFSYGTSHQIMYFRVSERHTTFEEIMGELLRSVSYVYQSTGMILDVLRHIPKINRFVPSNDAIAKIDPATLITFERRAGKQKDKVVFIDELPANDIGLKIIGYIRELNADFSKRGANLKIIALLNPGLYKLAVIERGYGPKFRPLCYTLDSMLQRDDLREESMLWTFLHKRVASISNSMMGLRDVLSLLPPYDKEFNQFLHFTRNCGGNPRTSFHLLWLICDFIAHSLPQEQRCMHWSQLSPLITAAQYQRMANAIADSPILHKEPPEHWLRFLAEIHEMEHARVVGSFSDLLNLERDPSGAHRRWFTVAVEDRDRYLTEFVRTGLLRHGIERSDARGRFVKPVPVFGEDMPWTAEYNAHLRPFIAGGYKLLVFSQSRASSGQAAEQ
jgi:hypothetical protein